MVIAVCLSQCLAASYLERWIFLKHFSQLKRHNSPYVVCAPIFKRSLPFDLAFVHVLI